MVGGAIYGRIIKTGIFMPSVNVMLERWGGGGGGGWRWRTTGSSGDFDFLCMNFNKF